VLVGLRRKRRVKLIDKWALKEEIRMNKERRIKGKEGKENENK
jgi:hypothetical protein